MTEETEGLLFHILRLLEASSINGGSSITSRDINNPSNSGPVDSQEILRALNKLKAREMVNYESHENTYFAVTEEGAKMAIEGDYCFRILAHILGKNGSAPFTDVESAISRDIFKIGLGHAMKYGLLKKDGELLVAKKSIRGGPVLPGLPEAQDQVKAVLSHVSQGNMGPSVKLEIPDVDKILADLQKRKLVEQRKSTWFSISKGSNFALELREQAADLTTEMLEDGSWKTASFRQCNLKALGVPPPFGSLHPLTKLRLAFREIFFEMGFEEMPTNAYVESSFWNFDALFQPQQHPARDAHDTFFLKDPASAVKIPADYMEKVRKVHSEGGYGSIGYRYDWKETEARKNILRTHTTAVSTRMLYHLAQQKPFRPVKYFSIDKVFRNETLDATHLAEFHQVEGLIADRNLGLGDLIGVLNEFFQKLGMKDLEFKPAYNPYTEPSMEVFAYHPGLGKRMEIGNSGIFRPEMLQPMGLPPDVTVIAWGLSLERPAMIQYEVRNIRDLVGHKVKLDFIRDNPICRIHQHRPL